MAATVKAPSGKTLHRRGHIKTTPATDTTAKIVSIKSTAEERLSENRAHLQDKNVRAFLDAIGEAEGGGYDFKYGAVKGKRHDKWRFTDFSTHPGPGCDGRTTAAGMYQENLDTWREMGEKMGLSDFSPGTQDLIAVEILRTIRVLDNVKSGDLNTALGRAAGRWAALPAGKGRPGLYPKQPSVSYEHFESVFKQKGGTTK